MKLNRSSLVVLCLGVALLLISGSAWAGTTATYPTGTGNASGPVLFAQEMAKANQLYNFPGVSSACSGNAIVTHFMNVIRNFNSGGTPQNYFVDLQLDSGYFNAADTGAGITVTNEPFIAVNRITDTSLGFYDPGPNAFKLRYYVHITGQEVSALPTVNIPLTAFAVVDSTGALVTLGGQIKITITTTDSASGVAFDSTSGDGPVPFMQSAYGIVADNLTKGGAVIDAVNLDRKGFVPGDAGLVTTAYDASGMFQVDYVNTAASPVNRNNGCLYKLSSASKIRLVIAGNFQGVSQLSWGSTPQVFTGSIPANVGTVTWDINGNVNDVVGSVGSTAYSLKFLVDGVTRLFAPQDFNLTVLEVLNTADSGPSPAPGPRTLFGPNIITHWDYNGVILTAIFQNGNGAVNNGRLYLFNPTDTDATIEAQVYTLPIGTATGVGGAPSVPWTASPVLLDVTKFHIPANNGFLNLRVFDDILKAMPANALGWDGSSPYITNGGNVGIILTITTYKAEGWSNVFNQLFSYGIIRMLNSGDVIPR